MFFKKAFQESPIKKKFFGIFEFQPKVRHKTGFGNPGFYEARIGRPLRARAHVEKHNVIRALEI